MAFLDEYRELSEDRKKIIKAFIPITEDEFYHFEEYSLNLITGDLYKNGRKVEDIEERERIVKMIEKGIEERIEELLRQLRILDRYVKELQIVNC